LLLIAVTVACLMDHDLLRFDGSWARAMLLLLFAPVLAAFGTNNFIFANAVLFAAAWVAAAATVSSLVDNETGLSAFVATCIAVMLVYGAVTGTWQHPYRQTPLGKVDTEILSGPARGLVVDGELAAFVSKFQSSLPQGDPPSAVIVWKQPGLAFATGSVQPVFGWISTWNPERVELSVVAACERDEGILLAWQEEVDPAVAKQGLDSPACQTREFREGPAIEIPGGSSLRVLTAE
jgi:hypothetical protein